MELGLKRIQELHRSSQISYDDDDQQYCIVLMMNLFTNRKI